MIENTCKTSIEQAEAQLVAIGTEAELTQQTLDEAIVYCDKSETRCQLLSFYSDVIDLSQKMNSKRSVLLNLKAEYLNSMHEYSRFLAGNFMPFKESMESRLKSTTVI